VISRPDILVLGGGGVLGEAWMIGVLAGIEDSTGFDLRRCEYFVGTSAGSIVAARLAAGESPQRPPAVSTALERIGSELGRPGAGTASTALTAARRAGAWAVALSSPYARLTLRAIRPGGALARAALLRTMPRTSESLSHLRRAVDASGAQFDGRLRVVAVQRSNGRRVVFGRPGAPPASVGQAVEASCTVPWMFAPVRIAQHEYVDGGVWSPTNLDAAPAGRGTHVLCLNPTANLTGDHPLLALARNTSRSVMSLEAYALRGRGVDVQLIAPDPGSVAAIGTNLFAREPRNRVLAAGYQQGLELTAR
jgi:NTE family protein